MAEPILDDLEEIRKAADRSADLIRHMLAFSRQQTIAPKVIDLNETFSMQELGFKVRAVIETP